MKNENGLSQTLIKESNKRKIIRTLWENSPVSRTGLAYLTGLNKATITNLMAEIVAEGMVTNVGQQKSSAGRSPNLIMFNENYGICAGVLIRPHIIVASISNVFAKILWQKDFLYSEKDDPIDVLQEVASMLREGVAACSEISTRLLGIGIGTASLLRQSDDMMYAVHSTTKWYNVPIGDFFRQNFKVPIWVDTVSNNAIVGEKYFGAARNISNAVFLSIGNGIGGGLLINGHLYRGVSGFAGDIGHFVVDPNGPQCRCGKRGCWEVMASALALSGGTSLDTAVREAESGNVAYITALNNIGQNIGRGIANLVRVLNPQKIILGGDIIVAGKWVMNPCRTELQTKLWPFVWESTQVEFAGLGKDSAILGCFTRVIEQLFCLEKVA
ncbi:MAG: ROK family protein [Anaerolineaceae bacterium]|jgi:predicted NBD/HSP70 family sugar kinase|nr:ROK family protein [Anaerolineaceae bacterium]